MNKSSAKNLRVFALILLTSALIIVATNPNLPSAKAATTDSVYVYTSCGGTILANGLTAAGGTTYNYTNGVAVNFTAAPIADFKFLCWEYSSASGTDTSTSNPFIYTIISTENEIQALFIPTVNASSISSSSKTGTAPIDVLSSIGGTTTPAAGTYTTYTIGTVISLTANPSANFKFLYWMVPSASGGAYTSTFNPIEYNLTANACAIQAYFIPASSSVALPTPTPTINEFSSSAAIITVTALVIAAFGTYAYTKKSRK
jgi:hypothetical protein